MADYTNAWENKGNNCKIESCILRSANCDAPYPQGKLKLQNFKVVGDTNVVAGWSETACIRCTDSIGGNWDLPN